MPDRPAWDEYFIGIAQAVAQRASCRRAKVGAVIVGSGRRIFAMGYNGAAPGEVDCIEAGCLMEDGHCQRALHAEVNAVAFAARFGVPIDGATMYLWSERADGEPMGVCRECAKVLSAANIKVVMDRPGHGVWTSERSEEVALCGDEFTLHGEVMYVCTLPAGHDDWHRHATGDASGHMWAQRNG